jgi:dTDP-4-amino-4,6-dideoxygalactose transaminase
MNLGFNKPYCSGRETAYISDALRREKISGDGYYTQLCHQFFEKKYQFKKVLLTSSCTDALEMASLLLDIRPGDEVIIPSYTFVSSANPFILRGAKVVFADSLTAMPHVDPEQIEQLITPRTKAIVVVHYGGVACEMEKVMAIAEKNNLFVIEDAAQAVDGYYKDRPLGGIGHLGCMSFHETKNITCGEGGLLVINDERFLKRAEVIWEKGTNRSAFFRGEASEYGWMDIGSSFLASEITAAFLYAQLESMSLIQARRKRAWEYYYDQLKDIEEITLPCIPAFSSNNGHMFYIMCKDPDTRKSLLDHLDQNGVQAITHYLPLHDSQFYKEKHDGRKLPNAAKHASSIIRLPLYVELSMADQSYIAEQVHKFFMKELNDTQESAYRRIEYFAYG